MSEVNGEENVSLAYLHNELTYEQERKQSDAKEVLIPVEENASLERKLLEESTRAGDLTEKLALNESRVEILEEKLKEAIAAKDESIENSHALLNDMQTMFKDYRRSVELIIKAKERLPSDVLEESSIGEEIIEVSTGEATLEEPVFTERHLEGPGTTAPDEERLNPLGREESMEDLIRVASEEPKASVAERLFNGETPNPLEREESMEDLIQVASEIPKAPVVERLFNGETPSTEVIPSEPPPEVPPEPEAFPGFLASFSNLFGNENETDMEDSWLDDLEREKRHQSDIMRKALGLDPEEIESSSQVQKKLIKRSLGADLQTFEGERNTEEEVEEMEEDVLEETKPVRKRISYHELASAGFFDSSSDLKGPEKRKSTKPLHLGNSTSTIETTISEENNDDAGPEEKSTDDLSTGNIDFSSDEEEQNKSSEEELTVEEASAKAWTSFHRRRVEHPWSR